MLTVDKESSKTINRLINMTFSFKTVIRPVDEDGNNADDDWEVGKQLSYQATQAALEAEELALLGLSPVKGLLLYGPVRT